MRLVESRTEDRGRFVARLLVGAWRKDPPAISLGPEALDHGAQHLVDKGVAGLVARQLGSGAPASRGVTRVRDAFRFDLLHEAVIEARLIETVAALRALDVEPILLKGWAAARRYPAPGLRPCVDLDLVVTPRARARVERAQLPLGEWGVDLHYALPELDHLSMEVILRRSPRAPLGSSDVAVLGSEDALRHEALHLARHGASRPGWLCDLALLLEGGSVELARLKEGDPRRTSWVMNLLALSVRLLGARSDLPLPIPPAWLECVVLREWGRAPRELSRWAELRGSPSRWPAALGSRWPNAVAAKLAGGRPCDAVGPRLSDQLAALRTRRIFRPNGR